MFSNSGLIILVCLVLLLISYTILLTKFRIQSIHRKNKAVSTHVTHIIVVFAMLVPALFINAHPLHSFPFDKRISMFSTVLFPLLNLMILWCHT